MELMYKDGALIIMVDKQIETSMYTNLTKNDIKNDTNKDKMDNTAYVKEIMEDYSSYKEFGLNLFSFTKF